MKAPWPACLFRAAGFAWLILAFFAAGCATPNLPAAFPPPETSVVPPPPGFTADHGEFYSVYGHAFVWQGEWKRLKGWLPMPIKAGAIICTAWDGGIEIVLGERLTLSNDSYLVVEQLDYMDKARDRVVHAKFFLKKGVLWGNTGTLSADSRYEIRLPTAQVLLKDATFAVCADGSVDVFFGNAVFKDGEGEVLVKGRRQWSDKPGHHGQPIPGGPKEKLCPKHRIAMQKQRIILYLPAPCHGPIAYVCAACEQEKAERMTPGVE